MGVAEAVGLTVGFGEAVGDLVGTGVGDLVGVTVGVGVFVGVGVGEEVGLAEGEGVGVPGPITVPPRTAGAFAPIGKRAAKVSSTATSG